MNKKEFDQSLHDTYDKLGRDSVKTFLHNEFGLTAVDNDDQYGIDLLVYRGGVFAGYAEVEVRLNWNTQQFPYQTIHIPYRKKKFFDLSEKVLFFAVKDDGSRLLYCSKDIILSSPVVNLSNKYVDNEYFYNVHIKSMRQGYV